MNSTAYDSLIYVCSEEQLRKKASVLFGIRFDDNKYSKLKEHLDTIKGNKDLVCVFFFLKKNHNRLTCISHKYHCVYIYKDFKIKIKIEKSAVSRLSW